MSSDELILSALQLGLYDVDITTGIVINRKGRALAMPPDKDGYRTVTLYFSKGKQRTVLVHRMVAIKAWGVEAVRDRQVGHRDGDRVHNALSNLWLPDTVKEHNAYDGTDQNLIKGQQKTKTDWPPCVRCETMTGPALHGCKSPSRINGKRLGVNGVLCWHCYRALDEREHRRKRKEAA